MRGPNYSHAAGGEPIIVPKFVHMPASEGVERLLAHPIGPTSLHQEQLPPLDNKE